MRAQINTILKSVFILGAIIDAGVAISWFLIAYGIDIPSIVRILVFHFSFSPAFLFSLCMWQQCLWPAGQLSWAGALLIPLIVEGFF